MHDRDQEGEALLLDIGEDIGEEALELNPVPPPPSNPRSWSDYVEKTFPVGSPVVFQPQPQGSPFPDYELLGFPAFYDHDGDLLETMSIKRMHRGQVPRENADDMAFVFIKPGTRAEVVQQIHGAPRWGEAPARPAGPPPLLGLVLRIYPPLVGTSPAVLVELFDDWKDAGFGDEIRVELPMMDILRSGQASTIKQMTIAPLTDTWGAGPRPLSRYRPNPHAEAQRGVMTWKCPEKARHPGDIVGCGETFDAEPDAEGLVDCPHCGIWFPTPRTPLHENEGERRRGCPPGKYSPKQPMRRVMSVTGRRVEGKPVVVLECGHERTIGDPGRIPHSSHCVVCPPDDPKTNPKIVSLGPFAAAAAANAGLVSGRSRDPVHHTTRVFEVWSSEPWGVSIKITVEDFDEDHEGAVEYLDDEIRETFGVGLDDYDQDQVADLEVGETYRSGKIVVERAA
ncbi:MAG TPA: hypothetical protein VIY27_06745 [Myxococcota bacterium]